MVSDRLATFSARMAVIVLWGLIFMMVLNAAVWLSPGLSASPEGSGLSFYLANRLIAAQDIDVAAFPWWQTLGAIVISSIPLLALAAGLLNIRAMFNSYAAGDYFSPSSARFMEKMGRSVVWWVALQFVCTPLMSMWVTSREPVGQRMVSVSFDSSSLVALFLAACIILVARVLHRASDLNAENQQFV